MKIKTFIIKSIFCNLHLIIILFIIQEAAIGKTLYPTIVPIITRNEANYETPENTLAARMSAFYYKDLDWFYETLTHESAERNRMAYERAGVDPNRMFEMSDPEDKTYILEKSDYKNGVVLLGKSIDKNGTILIDPITFVKEGNLWKQTSAYNKDDALVEKSVVVLPDSILKTVIHIHPKSWNYNLIRDRNRHNKVAKKTKHNKYGPKLLCILGTLKDKEGASRDVSEVDQETLLLNYVVHPLLWQHSMRKDVGLILKNGHEEMKQQKRFKEWKKKHSPFVGFDGPVMLIRFSLAEALKSLDDVEPGKKYMILVTGQLKDGSHFQGEAEITIVPDEIPENSVKPFWWEAVHD